MKNIRILLLLLCAAFSSTAQPVVSTKINKGYNPYYSAIDSVAYNGHDTMYAAISGTRNSVGFNFLVHPYIGPTDSFYVKVYANKTGSNTSRWTLLTTLNAGYTDTLLDYNILSAAGNPYTNYMCVFGSTNLLPGAFASWKTYCLIR